MHARAALTKRGDTAGLRALEQETEPLMLLGGDELTVSLHPLFDELGLTPLVAAKLNDKDGAKSRVAITRTDGQPDARMGHMDAMADAQDGHDLLKDVEALSRKVQKHAEQIEPPDLAG